MENLLKGKVALITGAGQGIGRGIAEQYAKYGATVYANDIREGSIEDFSTEMKEKYGSNVIPLYFNITDMVAAKANIMRIKNEQSHLDILVNNAGIMKDALIGMISTKLIESIFSVNVFGLMEMLQLAAKLMMRQKSGSIINMASIVGVNGNRGQLIYSASKGAVIAATKTAAKELAPYGIRVNAVAPGIIDTAMFRSIDDIHQKQRIDNIGMGRLGTPEDIAKACVFLASDLSEYVTGQILGVDGAAIV